MYSQKEISKYSDSPIKHSLLFGIIILYVFFLPLRSVEIPGIFVGFSINPARFFSVLTIILLYINICLDTRYIDGIFKSGVYSNPFLNLLILYFICSILFYYVSLCSGHSILFGDNDFFFRSWKGRPIGQFLSFITYGVVPFYITKKYAQDRSARKIIERTIVSVTIVLIYYGVIQQVCFYLGLPVTGRDLFEGRIAAENIMGKWFLRFYSLGGEPRHFGGFIIGALMFYIFVNYGKKGLFYKLNICLIIASFLLTFSTTCFVIAFFSIMAIIIDSIYHRRSRYSIKLFLICLTIAAILFSTGAIPIVAGKSMKYYEAFKHFITGPDIYAPRQLVTQAPNLSIIYYFKNITSLNPLNLFFGYGYGNFLSGINDILIGYFDWDIVRDGKITSPSFYLFWLFVECGLMGILIYTMLFLHTLKLSEKLLRYYKRIDRIEYQKTLFLRYSFIIFFISNLFQISFYYFIIMGLIIGKLNSVTASKKSVWENRNASFG